MQSFLNGETAVTKTGASLVLVEQVIVVLSGCVIMFSELESVLDDLKTECHLDAIDRMRWARNDSIITGNIQRLQNHKASMNLMLTILSWSALTERRSWNLRLRLTVQLIQGVPRHSILWIAYPAWSSAY